MTGRAITASMLYSFVCCPHRVTMDVFADAAERDPVNAFVELLWERGASVERERINSLGASFTNLQSFSTEAKARMTREAMAAGHALIYGGRIEANGLLGEPDLLRKVPGGYVPCDIKSGAGEEGAEGEGSFKKSYVVQLALYIDILERMEMSGGRYGFIWDVAGEEIRYDMQALRSARSGETWWEFYQQQLHRVASVLEQSHVTAPAYASGTCKNCHWYSSCLKAVKEADDLTLIAELGRTSRDAMVGGIRTVAELAEINPEEFIEGSKTVFKGIGRDSLLTFHARAKLLKSPNASPYLKAAIVLPARARELFFDIEVDPMRDLCYLHGFIERHNRDNASERFTGLFVSDASTQAERGAFAEAIAYIRQSQPCAIFYYSKYERTIYRKLQAKYPDVCTTEEIEQIFDPKEAVDLYFDVVKPHTEWPTSDFSIKTLAKYLGFKWRDTHPSGAASIQWFDDWVNTGATHVRQRILEYNEDDCRATRVLLDGIRELQ